MVRRDGGRRAARRHTFVVQPLESHVLFDASAEFVIHISVDGLRPDAVTRLGKAELPNFYRLREQGAFTDNARTDHDYTITLPNHATQITGRPVVGDIGHNWTTNTDPTAGGTIHSNKGAYVASAWDVAHDHGLRTGLYASKTKFSLFDASYDGDATALQGGAADAYPADGDHGRDKIHSYLYDGDSARMTDAFVSSMSSNPFGFVMVHYHDPDTAGHSKGWMGTDYLNALRHVDAQLGKIFNLIAGSTSPFAGRTALVVTADHGGSNTGHGDPTDPLNYTIPFYVWGPGVSAGADLYALNPASRANPGTGRVDNAARPQPIRDGDAGNLAMDFLDLPPVAGSLFNAALDLAVAPASPAGAPAATVTAPQDNGPEDQDPAAGSVWVTSQQPSFQVKLVDEQGVDDATVSASALRMTRDGVPASGYDFAYAADTDTVTLSPAGGGSFSYALYELFLNDTFSKVKDLAGNPLDATRLRVHVDGSAVQPAVVSFQQRANGYAGTHDTQLQSYGPDVSYGTAVEITVDGDEPPNTGHDSQGLLRFDGLFGDGAGQVPAGSEIRSAKLELAVINPGTAVNLHRMLRSWSGSDTWNSMGGGVSADGAEARATADANFTASATGTYSIDVTAGVQAWSDGAAANYGWVLLPTGTDGVDFYSSEGATAPRLVVEYVSGTAPVANSDAYSTDEDTPLVVAAPGVLANDIDADGDALSVVLVSGPSRGTLALDADGSFAYTPAADFHGTDSFTYRATGGGAASDPATVSVYVAEAPDVPVAEPDAYSVAEDGTLAVPAPGVLANDSDPDAESDPDHAGPLSATLASGPSHGTLAFNADGSFAYQPHPDFWGTDSFTYAASDADGSSAPATVTITVEPADDGAPVAADDSAATGEDVAVAIDVLANDTDPDGEPLRPELATAPAHGAAVVNADGTVTYTPAANYSGSDSFTYVAKDAAGASAAATVTVTIAATNDAPSAADDSFTLAEDSALAVGAAGVLANDADAEGDALSAFLVSGPGHGTLSLAPDGSFTYTPSENFGGTDSFTYQSSDGTAVSEPATVTLIVAPTNDAPAAADDAYSATEGTQLTVAAPGVLENDSDPDGDTLAASIETPPSNGTLTLNPNGSFTYSPTAGFTGSDSFRYAVSDGAGGAAVASVTLTVNAAPAVYATAETTVHGTVLAGSLGVNQSIQEARYGGNKRARLEQRWEFNLAGTGHTFYLQARHNSAGEHFAFAYSTDNTSWSQMLTVTATTDTDTYQTFALPATVGGRVFVRAVDTNSQNTDTSADTLFVEDMYFRAAAAVVPAAPAAPSGLTATAASSSQINLAWADNSENEDGFRIERSTDGQNFSAVATVGAGVTGYADAGLAASTAYVYRVLAFNAGGESAYSPSAGATTAPAQQTAPAAPTGLTAEVTQKNKVRLKWLDNSSNEAGFYVWVSGDGVNWTRYATVAAKEASGTTVQFTTGSLSGQQYFRVTAFLSDLESAPTNVVSVKL